jgi:hypothetical protein
LIHHLLTKPLPRHATLHAGFVTPAGVVLVWIWIMDLFASFVRDERGSMVANIGKAAIAIAFLSGLAANWLAVGVSEGDKSNLAQIAATATGRNDPMTTGSISKRAADTKIDPCLLPLKR